ncbi:hypothetical protein [Chromobacterium violaceum]|uniref:hypothetical protein n=1 Tax=Chromobacterium violaceum TaxID=536 RepID=UPI001CC81FEA|nr:hypothetical protein [Chromobacterium violaceum]
MRDQLHSIRQRNGRLDARVGAHRHRRVVPQIQRGASVRGSGAIRQAAQPDIVQMSRRTIGHRQAIAFGLRTGPHAQSRDGMAGHFNTAGQLRAAADDGIAAALPQGGPQPIRAEHGARRNRQRPVQHFRVIACMIAGDGCLHRLLRPQRRADGAGAGQPGPGAAQREKHDAGRSGWKWPGDCLGTH